MAAVLFAYAFSYLYGSLVSEECLTLVVLIEYILPIYLRIYRESIMIPICKKDFRSDCLNHQGISFISIGSKVFVSILLRRLSAIQEFCLWRKKLFRTDRGCIDQIFTLRKILEHCHVHRRSTIVVFLDIRAFVSIDRTSLWNCLLKSGVPDKFVATLQELYHHTEQS